MVQNLNVTEVMEHVKGIYGITQGEENKWRA